MVVGRGGVSVSRRRGLCCPLPCGGGDEGAVGRRQVLRGEGGYFDGAATLFAEARARTIKQK